MNHDQSLSGTKFSIACIPNGQVTLIMKDGVAWTHLTLKAKGLTEVSPLPLILIAGLALYVSNNAGDAHGIGGPTDSCLAQDAALLRESARVSDDPLISSVQS